MSTADTPAVARHRVRTKLRAAREERQLTQGRVADAMEWSLSKVMRIEKGEVNISPADLRMLLAYLDITDPAEVKRLVEDARTARKGRLAPDTRFKEHLTQSLLQLMQFEEEATTIRYYGSVVVPGLLQTAGYARAIFEDYADELNESSIEVRIEARQRRREILYRPDPPRYLAILDESVLLREVGGPAVMGEQLNELLRIIDETSIQVRVIPFEVGASIALLGPFTMLDLGGEDDSVLYRESFVNDEIVHLPKTLDRHRRVFNHLWDQASNEDHSKDLIRQRGAEMIAKARRAGQQM
jgi:transcriptional regulator with XRE-family HTH domain